MSIFLLNWLVSVYRAESDAGVTLDETPFGTYTTFVIDDTSSVFVHGCEKTTTLYGELSQSSFLSRQTPNSSGEVTGHPSTR